MLLQLRRIEPRLILSVADARELAQIAGHYLLRGERLETIRAVVAHGLPPEGVRCPKGFVRNRLLHYLPPVPDWPKPEPKPTFAQVAPRPKVSLVKPARFSLPGRESPARIVQDGGGWREAFRVAGVEGTRRASGEQRECSGGLRR